MEMILRYSIDYIINLSTSACLADCRFVRIFLQGLEPIDVLIVQRHGKSTGEAFAVLAHPAELDMALRKNKAYLGTRYIEVFETRKIDYYKAIVDTMSHNGGMHERRGRDNRSRSRTPPPRKPRGGQQKSQGPEPGTTSIVKLRGLPFSADPDRVLEFFSDSDLGIDLPSTEKVLIATGADHRPNGMAFVEFDSPRTAEIALKKHKQMMGSRYVEVFLASVDERARYIPLH
jgi:heterogeneous nuclear ribonucleoprotein F/H